MGEHILSSSPSGVLQQVRLPSPAELKAKFPLSNKAIWTVESARRDINDILSNCSQKKLVIVGPCSIHDPNAALEYAKRLAAVKSRFPSLCLLMRSYFEKPRTQDGWTGFINDPTLDCTYDIPYGLSETRRLLTRITELGVPCATELVSVVSPKYFEDCISFVAVGARTVESQLHREMASQLIIPVGFKNSSSGNIDVAVKAIIMASRKRGFIGIDNDGRATAIQSTGNPNCGVILRGSYSAGPNYSLADIDDCASKLSADGIATRSVIVDAAHGNSNKSWKQQIKVVQQVASYKHPRLAGIMIESFLKSGNQKLNQEQPQELRYGVSITDECIDWQQTVQLLEEIDKAEWGKHSSNGHSDMNGNGKIFDELIDK